MCGLSAFEVFLAEKVVDSLDGVEGCQGHFDEDGGPISHGTVPKAGEFLRFECGGSFGLLADESGGGVDILPKVEIAAVVVLGSAY